jgi:DNA-binding CsgD family transcriptional regulator
MMDRGDTSMPSRRASTLARIYNAPLAPDAWRSVLVSLSELAGSDGAALILQQQQTLQVISAEIVGIAQDLTKDYLEYYAELDPYLPEIYQHATDTWVSLGEFKLRKDLRQSEWYNDFICKHGVAEIEGICLTETPSLRAVLGLHYTVQRQPTPSKALRGLIKPLVQAVRLDLELRTRKWQASLGLSTLSRLSIGLILINDLRRVVEMNATAESIVRRADAFAIRDGRIVLRRRFEAEKLSAFIAAVSMKPCHEGKMFRMLVGRAGGNRPYTLTIMPDVGFLTAFGRAGALVLITDPDIAVPSEIGLSELFGLSPAESRVAVSLIRGQTLLQIAVNTGVQITTLRTQIRSILKKVGVHRQTDLVATLSTIFTGGA